MELDEIQAHMELLMETAYTLASIPIEEIISRLKRPMILTQNDQPFLPEKNNLMVRIFESCLIVKKLMIEIQPEVSRIKKVEESIAKGTHLA